MGNGRSLSKFSPKLSQTKCVQSNFAKKYPHTRVSDPGSGLPVSWPDGSTAAKMWMILRCLMRLALRVRGLFTQVTIFTNECKVNMAQEACLATTILAENVRRMLLTGGNPGDGWGPSRKIFTYYQVGASLSTLLWHYFDDHSFLDCWQLLLGLIGVIKCPYI